MLSHTLEYKTNLPKEKVLSLLKQLIIEEEKVNKLLPDSDITYYGKIQNQSFRATKVNHSHRSRFYYDLKGIISIKNNTTILSIVVKRSKLELYLLSALSIIFIFLTFFQAPDYGLSSALWMTIPAFLWILVFVTLSSTVTEVNADFKILLGLDIKPNPYNKKKAAQ